MVREAGLACYRFCVRRYCSARRMAEFLASLSGIHDISLLPYHNMGSQKYKNLNVTYSNPDTEPPSKDTVAGIREALEDQGFKVRIGG